MTGESKFILGIGVATVVAIALGITFFSKTANTTPKSQNIDQSQLISGAKNTFGEATASVKIVEFADFQCPACGMAHPILKEGLANNKDKVFFVYKHYPLPIHQNAKVAAQASEAAAKQGKFWEMHDMIYEKQNEWSSAKDAKEIFKNYAKLLSLNMDQFSKDIVETGDLVMRDYAQGNKFGVESTPTFFVNGKIHPGVIQKEELDEIINGK